MSLFIESTAAVGVQRGAKYSMYCICIVMLVKIWLGTAWYCSGSWHVAINTLAKLTWPTVGMHVQRWYA
jgi:hypothetical protein